MTNTEIALIDEAELAELAALVGADPEAQRGSRVPMLKVNMDDEDENGNELPRGQFFITEQGEPVYAKTVKIRPLAMHFQYTDFDGDAKKLKSKTLLNTAFNQDFLDTKGTVRCGRPDSKQWKKMTDEEKAPFSGVTCTRQIGVLVSYTGKTKDGKEVEVENVPAMVKLKGSNFMGFDEEYYGKLPKGRKIWDYWSEVSLERKKNGSVVYFVWHFETDFASATPLDRVTLDTIRYFGEMAQSENKRIRADHDAAVRSRQGDTAAYDAVGGDDYLDGDLDDDFVDAA